MKRGVDITYLGAGDRDEIVMLFPYVDQSEDDSGSLPMQALVNVTRHDQYALDVLVLAQCAKNIPPDCDGEMLYTAIDREVKRSYALTELAKQIEVPVEHGDQLWFLVTWDLLSEEEADHGSVSIH